MIDNEDWIVLMTVAVTLATAFTTLSAVLWPCNFALVHGCQQ